MAKKLHNDINSGHGKATYKDYLVAIEKYLIPSLGKYKVDSIDYKALDKLNADRLKKMKSAPTKSTLLTHNAALNRIFDEAIYRGYMVASNKPVLIAKGKKSERRDEFTVKEIKALRGNFEKWIERGREDAKELRALLRDYVEVLLDTGARPGKELLDLNWGQLELTFDTAMDSSSVQNMANYQLISAGRDGKLGTRDDTKLTISMVTYNSATRLAMITSRQAMTTTGIYRLTALATSTTAGLKSGNGKLIDGDNNGSAGGNYTLRAPE